ncbi:MAG: hypothetical protein R3C59_10585 [Planctomycetaceae bacterium]
MSDFENGFFWRIDGRHELPGIGQLPSERTTFAVADGFDTLPELLRDDLICCCESCESTVLSVLWIPDTDHHDRPLSVVQQVNGVDVVQGVGCVMELKWRDGTFYFLNT